MVDFDDEDIKTEMTPSVTHNQ